jgi:hypothetical protein
MVDYHPFHGRHLIDRLLDALADSPVVLVNGARQTGKSTPAIARVNYTATQSFSAVVGGVNYVISTTASMGFGFEGEPRR